MTTPLERVLLLLVREGAAELVLSYVEDHVDVAEGLVEVLENGGETESAAKLRKFCKWVRDRE